MTTHACLACGSPATAHQSVLIRGRETDLFRCPKCGMFFFPQPTWLPEVYAEPISDLDIGLPLRCINHARIAEAIIRAERMQERPHLDWAGGYGLLTRLVRDRGLDMRHYEEYADNIFARGFEGGLGSSYGAITAIEVFEHLEQPLAALTALSEAADMVIVSTELVPAGMTDLGSWWYVGPCGQHIAFFTEAALRAMADQCGYQLTSNGKSIHVFHRRRLRLTTRLILRDVRSSILAARLLRLKQRSKSLRDSDGEQLMADYLAKAPFEHFDGDR
jgi:hypothetical protein